MNKKDLLNKYAQQEEKFLVSKIIDKVELVEKRNKIEYTDFLNMYEQEIVVNVLKYVKFKEYILYGGNEKTERKILIIYPNKFKGFEEIVLTDTIKESNIIEIVRIVVPKNLEKGYTHKNYLGGLMKLGIKREKIGDIVVDDTGADIIVKKDISEYLIQNLGSLIRFRKSDISIINDLEKLKKIDIKKEKIEIIVNSLRLDGIISGLLKISRNKSIEIINQERVFVNFKVEDKCSKMLKIGDKITVRGKGKFELIEKLRSTKNDRSVLSVEKVI